MHVIVMGTYCQVSEDEVVLSRIQLQEQLMDELILLGIWNHNTHENY